MCIVNFIGITLYKKIYPRNVTIRQMQGCLTSFSNHGYHNRELFENLPFKLSVHEPLIACERVSSLKQTFVFSTQYHKFLRSSALYFALPWKPWKQDVASIQIR